MSDDAMQIGRYTVLEELGSGAFSTVYRVQDTVLGRELALKVMHPALLSDATFIERFEREARVVAGLRHSHIVIVYDYGEYDDRLCLVMDLLTGGSLADLLAAGPLPWERALEIAQQVAGALDYAHERNLIHRDVKPHNILLDDEGRAVLADFGVVHALQSGTVASTLSGGVVGTAAYIPAEIWDGEPPSPRTDIYALACVVYEMVTAERLFQGSSLSNTIRRHLRPPEFPEEWPEGVPAGLERVLAKALAQEPGERYESAGAFVEALAGLDVPGSGARAESPPSSTGEETEGVAVREDAADRTRPPAVSSVGQDIPSERAPAERAAQPPPRDPEPVPTPPAAAGDATAPAGVGEILSGRLGVKSSLTLWLLLLSGGLLIVLCLVGVGAFTLMQQGNTDAMATGIAATQTQEHIAQMVDNDGDGLTNVQEASLGTDSGKADTDEDGLTDGEEAAGPTDPLDADTDGDGLPDGDERAYGADPLVQDTDGDTLSDGDEVIEGTSPINPDTDGDGTNDNADPDPGRLPTFTPSPTPTLTPTATGTAVPPTGTPTSTDTPTPPSLTPVGGLTLVPVTFPPLPPLDLVGPPGYVWANEPTSSSYTPDTRFAQNSAGDVTISRSDVGRYAVRFAGMGGSGGGNVQVTAYGTGSETCKVVNWDAFGEDFTVNVSCFDADGRPADARYTVLVTRTTGGGVGYVWANEPSSDSYAPDATYAHNDAGDVTISRGSVGEYAVQFGGMGGNSGGNVQVTAHGSGSEACQVVGWSAFGADFTVNVRCFAADGQPVDTRYSLLVTQIVEAGIGYVWANEQTSESYTPQEAYSHNDAGGVTITRSGVGQYAVRFAEMGGNGRGNVQVTAYGSGSEICNVINWSAFAADFTVNVRCFDAAGQPVDARYTVLVTR